MYEMSDLEQTSVLLPQRRAVLVVEDDVFLKPFLRRILRSIDPYITMHWAVSVESARMQLEETCFSMVIADCLLPNETSGLQVWEFCKANLPGTPFLMISGLSQKTIQYLHGDHRLVPPHLRKPFSAKDCRVKIREVLGERSSQ
jgi:DNA-binding NtrC family response regulator